MWREIILERLREEKELQQEINDGDETNQVWVASLSEPVLSNQCDCIQLFPAGTKQAHNVIRRWYLVVTLGDQNSM